MQTQTLQAPVIQQTFTLYYCDPEGWKKQVCSSIDDGRQKYKYLGIQNGITSLCLQGPEGEVQSCFDPKDRNKRGCPPKVK